MSSEHAIIIARNSKTGAIELPLDDLTLYSTEGYSLYHQPKSIQSIIDSVRMTYDDDWVITLYEQCGPNWCGSKKRPTV